VPRVYTTESRQDATVSGDGYPIVFGGPQLLQAFFQPTYDGFIPTPDSSDPKSADHGLHAMLIVGCWL
jgi:hypothetical protein